MPAPTPPAGALLVATPAIGDGVFARAVVLLLDHDEGGTLGVVLSEPLGLAAESVLGGGAGRAAEPAVVFRGGPVEPDVQVVLGVDPDGRLGWGPLAPGAPLPQGDLRVFAGYAGWAPGQLVGELEQQAWWVLPARPGDVLAARPTALWRRLVRRLPPPASWASTMPADPRHN